jgi:choline dehydrogenase
VLPLFKRQETNVRGSSEHHGAAGPLNVADLQTPHPLAQTFIQAAQAAGYLYNPDINGPQIDGFGYVQATQFKGWRCSASRAFIDPVRKRPNLTVSIQSTAQRILIENGRAIGIEALVDNRTLKLEVSGEIIVSCGAIASPQLLMLSGIGDPAELKNHGISVRVERPEVGRNLQDHPGLGMTYEVGIPTYNREMKAWKKLIHGANWLLRGRGVATTPDAHLIGFLRSDAAQAIPDIQVHVTPAGFRVAGEGELILEENSFTVIASVCRPRSRGSIGLKSADATTPPAIRHRLFDDSDDLFRLLRGIRAIRRIVDAPPLRTIVKRPIQPPWNEVSDAVIAEYLIENAGTIYHPSGTCRMGADADAVVDPDLKVLGVSGLRVADASIMPRLTSGNLNAPCMMIGEKAAELILANGKH